MKLSDIADLLEKNYYALKSNNCKKKTVKLFNTLDDVLDEDPIHVKYLTKVGRTIYDSNPEHYHWMLPKLYMFNIQGAESLKKRIKKNQIRDTKRDTKTIMIIYSHFYTHSATLLQIIAEKEKNTEKKTELLIKAFEHRYDSVIIALRYEPIHAAKTLSYAADLAATISEYVSKKRKINWKKRQYESRLWAAEVQEDFSAYTTETAYNYFFAAITAEELENWKDAKNCYDCARKYFSKCQKPKYYKKIRQIHQRIRSMGRKSRTKGFLM